MNGHYPRSGQFKLMGGFFDLARLLAVPIRDTFYPVGLAPIGQATLSREHHSRGFAIKSNERECRF